MRGCVYVLYGKSRQTDRQTDRPLSGKFYELSHCAIRMPSLICNAINVYIKYNIVCICVYVYVESDKDKGVDR